MADITTAALRLHVAVISTRQLTHPTVAADEWQTSNIHRVPVFIRALVNNQATIVPSVHYGVTYGPPAVLGSKQQCGYGGDMLK